MPKDRKLNFPIGANHPFFLMAGPCVIESESLIMSMAETLKALTDELGIPYIFKASFDKANRSSISGFRGPGREEGLKILDKVRHTFDVPVVTDVHDCVMIPEVADVVDVLQIPAFLCRQTDIIQAAAQYGAHVNIKKGQFLAPADMKNVVKKAKDTNSDCDVWVCERGSCFGYNNLVVDMRALIDMRDTGCPVVFDATHSVQRPGGLGDATGGDRHMIPALARAACAIGVQGLFMETHPVPREAKSDAANAWPLDEMRPLLQELMALDQIAKSRASEFFGTHAEAE